MTKDLVNIIIGCWMVFLIVFFFEYKCKSMSDAKCEYCECEKEDIKYLIFDCFTVQRLWKNWIVLRISVHTGNTSL